MAKTPPRSPMAGGALLALSLIVGTFIGVAQGQPSVGFLAGLAVGVALLVIVMLVDRARG